MHSPRWIAVAVLALPGLAVAQLPGQTPDDTAAQTQDDVVLNPIDPIGEEEEDSEEQGVAEPVTPPGNRAGVRSPTLEGTGADPDVGAAGELEDETEDPDMAGDVDPIGEVDPLGEADDLGGVDRIGEVDPIGDPFGDDEDDAAPFSGGDLDADDESELETFSD